MLIKSLISLLQQQRCSVHVALSFKRGRWRNAIRGKTRAGISNRTVGTENNQNPALIPTAKEGRLQQPEPSKNKYYLVEMGQKTQKGHICYNIADLLILGGKRKTATYTKRTNYQCLEVQFKFQ